MQAKTERQQAMTDVRRALVLDAARAVFEKLGIEGASIREIARAAGYTPGAIYFYYDSKEAIYGALLAESLERLNDWVAQAGPALSTPLLCWKPRPVPGLIFMQTIRVSWTWVFTWCKECGRAA